MGMGMGLARVSRAAIEKAARDAGLALTAEQAREITEAESTCLSECRRVSFGESAAVRVVREFAESPFIAGDGDAETIAKLVEAFYELREDHPASISDTEILELLGESFDGDAGGDVGLAASLAGEALSRRHGHSAYEIADADGKVYRWDPAEWRDDALPGEAPSKWEDCAAYEISDDGGKVYRWDPAEWRDDVTADGWYGERWEDADE